MPSFNYLVPSPIIRTMAKFDIDSARRILRGAFKTDDSRFVISVGLKVSGISFAVSLAVFLFLYQVMRLNYAFFRAAGFFNEHDGSVFFDFLVKEAAGNLTVLFAYHIFLFFIGTYVGWIILRPFRNLGQYCEQVIEHPNMPYRVDEFSAYKLLTRFSEFFFEFLREARRKGSINVNSIPPQYSRIHRPVLDKIFMFHFGLLLVIICISSSIFISENASSIFNSMVELATSSLEDRSGIGKRFFSRQIFIVDEVVIMTVVLLSLSYLALGLHLYAKVSGAAFAIFSTMRAFMKGNHFSRVHLIGYAYLREHTRKLNKYLDYIQNNLNKDSTKG
jgi:hypothetical protein